MTRSYQSSRVARMDRAKARQRRRKVFVTVKWALIGGVTMAAYKMVSEIAALEHGTRRTPGGELMILLLPVIWLMGECVIRDVIQDVKECMRQITRERVMARRGK